MTAAERAMVAKLARIVVQLAGMAMRGADSPAKISMMTGYVTEAADIARILENS